MGKVPVGRTISGGYRFLALRPGAVLGMGWLPAAFYAAGVWFCLQRLGAAMLVAVPSSATFNEFTAVDFLLAVVVSAVLIPTMAVPFAMIALGRSDEHAVAHFVYGKREFKLSLALAGYFALTIAVLAAVAFIAQFAIGVGLPKPGEPLSGFAMPAEWYGVPLVLWLNGAAAILLLIVSLFLSVRLGFYLAPLAAADEHVTLGRSWALSRRSFWRLAVVHVTLAVPVMLVLAGAIYAVEGDTLVPVLRAGWTGVPSEGMSALYRLQYEHASALAGIWAAITVAASALFTGAASTAYRVVVLGEEEAAAPVAAAAPVPTRTEPDFEPAWAAAKAMADASPRWRQAPVELPPEDHALASEAAAMTHVEAEPVAETYAAEAPVEHEAAPPQYSEAPAEEPAPAEYAAEPAATHAALSDFILLPPEALQAASAELAASPLDPAGTHAALREKAGQLGE
ncbi:MAG TPA: hypothetical protein VHU87_12170 [Rhizomicrobium sp.]|jgi:hypothetical protein|nr:hypothetical protein [Rhizomicrobium sp.]